MTTEWLVPVKRVLMYWPVPAVNYGKLKAISHATQGDGSSGAGSLSSSRYTATASNWYQYDSINIHRQANRSAIPPKAQAISEAGRN